MVSGYTLPPPAQLEIHDSNASEKWKRFFLAWTNYALATELGNKSEAVQVATLLTVIGDEGREIYSTFTWDDEDADEIEPGLTKFAEYCQPRKNIPFERYRCNQRIQELGESFKQYRRQGYRRIWYVFWGDFKRKKYQQSVWRIHDSLHTSGGVRKLHPCYVLPLYVYKLASNDRKLEKVKSVQTSLEAHVGSKIKVIGHVTIRVWRNKVSSLLGCRLIESREIFPILERKACLGMKIIQYNDNDQPHKPQTEGAAVYNVDSNLGSVLTRKGNTGEVANSARWRSWPTRRRVRHQTRPKRSSSPTHTTQRSSGPYTSASANPKWSGWKKEVIASVTKPTL